MLFKETKDHCPSWKSKRYLVTISHVEKPIDIPVLIVDSRHECSCTNESMDIVREFEVLNVSIQVKDPIPLTRWKRHVLDIEVDRFLSCMFMTKPDLAPNQINKLPHSPMFRNKVSVNKRKKSDQSFILIHSLLFQICI